MSPMVVVDQELIASVANALKRQYREVDLADIRQELYLYWVEHHRMAEKYLSDEEEGKLTRALQNAGRVYCLREHAYRHRYDASDIYLYSTAVIRETLPFIWDIEDWMYAPETDSEVRSNQDPAFGGNRIASLGDVARAFEVLEVDDRQVIRLAYEDGLSDVELGVELEISTDAAKKRLERAIKRLQKALGGEPVDWSQSRRRAKTNAATRAALEGQ